MGVDNFHQVVIADSGDGKNCEDDENGDGFLYVSLDGNIVDTMNFGYTFVGTISPTFNMEEAYGYFDGSTTYEASLPYLPLTGTRVSSKVHSLHGFMR